MIKSMYYNRKITKIREKCEYIVGNENYMFFKDDRSFCDD